MLEPDAPKLPRIRLRDPRSMRHGDDPLVAVAKAGGQRLRLHSHGGDWVVTRWCHTHVRGQTRPDWVHPLGRMSREAAVAAFMVIVAQRNLFHATVVIASASAVRP